MIVIQKNRYQDNKNIKDYPYHIQYRDKWFFARLKHQEAKNEFLPDNAEHNYIIDIIWEIIETNGLSLIASSTFSANEYFLEDAIKEAYKHSR